MMTRRMKSGRLMKTGSGSFTPPPMTMVTGASSVMLLNSASAAASVGALPGTRIVTGAPWRTMTGLPPTGAGDADSDAAVNVCAASVVTASDVADSGCVAVQVPLAQSKTESPGGPTSPAQTL